MTKFKLIICCIVSALLVQGCDQVLESVLLSDGTQDIQTLDNQEEFDITIKSLTFKNAKIAKNDPYQRQLMLTGIGKKANLFNEDDFLSPKIPVSLSPKNDYLLGIGDVLSYQQLNEFAKLKTNIPAQKTKNDYLLGIGDQLTLIQFSGDVLDSNNILLNVPRITNNNGNESVGITQKTEGILKTSGVVGTDGNILLLGLGSIEAKNRSLNSIQTEVRNILIRNGLTPSFQLEITGFNSKKAFVTFQALENKSLKSEYKFGKNMIPITNLPITLKEVILNFGLQPSERETLITTLVRDNQKYRMTAGQIFENSTDHVIIQDRDQIEIMQAEPGISVRQNAVVGSNGNILLPYIGSLKAEKRSLAQLRSDITNILYKKGMIPSFQLEITKFNSKKFFLVTKQQNSKIVTLTDNELNLKEAVLGSESIDNLGDINQLTIINLVRDNTNYQMTFQEMLNGLGSKVQIQNGDTIELKGYDYKPGQVFALGGAGNAQLVSIDPSKRETLADILFSEDGVLKNLLAKRSEIYLLRGQSPSIAYHLDAQNVSRILVAAEMELRPNDIVYVADRPIISFSRVLAEILPLRLLLRDIKDNNIP